MLSALAWVIAIIGFAGGAGCIALQGYFVWRANADPDAKADSQSKFVMGLAAFFGFFLIAIVGAILLQISGAYDIAR